MRLKYFAEVDIIKISSGYLETNGKELLIPLIPIVPSQQGTESSVSPGSHSSGQDSLHWDAQKETCALTTMQLQPTLSNTHPTPGM